MIVKEYVENGTRVRHYSDLGFYILQNETGIEYCDAVDALDAGYTYSEVYKLIEEDKEVIINYG